MKCPECGAPMFLRVTAKFKTKDGKNKVFYGCSNFPECRGTHGAHPDGQPLGIPATAKVKKLRQEVHKLLEKRYGGGKTLNKAEKNRMYKWLERFTKSVHIAMMGEKELAGLIKRLERIENKHE